MSLLLLAMLGALVAGLGGYGLYVTLAPGPADPRAAIRNVTPSKNTSTPRSGGLDGNWLADWDDYRIGRLAETEIGWTERLSVPDADIAIMRLTREEFLGRKIKLAAFGVILGFLFVAVPAYGLGSPQSPLVYLLVSAGVATGLWFLVGYSVHDSAEKRREAFAQVLAPYAELVALSRSAGKSTRVALYQGAGVSDSWAFVWLQDELDQADLTGTPVNVAIRQFGQQIDVQALEDLANLLDLSKDGNVADSLQAHAASAREAQLYDEKGKAAAMSTKLGIPMAGLVVVFLVALAAPGVMAFLGT